VCLSGGIESGDDTVQDRVGVGDGDMYLLRVSGAFVSRLGHQTDRSRKWSWIWICFFF
jgi:hypothetical protein